jgi:hypothetical protein
LPKVYKTENDAKDVGQVAKRPHFIVSEELVVEAYSNNGCD